MKNASIRLSRRALKITRSSYRSMISRCYNPNNIAFPRYGGRLIGVAPSWRTSIENFIGDMGPRPSVDYSIERKSFNRSYTPANCFWIRNSQQNCNKSDNVFFTVNGEKMCLAGMARKFGQSPRVVSDRLNRGWPVRDALELDHRNKMVIRRISRVDDEGMAPEALVVGTLFLAGVFWIWSLKEQSLDPGQSGLNILASTKSCIERIGGRL